MENYKDKSILVTGAAGTVGSELVRQLIDADVGHVICLDNNETELFFLKERYSNSPSVSCYLADIRDGDELIKHTRGIDILLHAAALKHVTLCEASPDQAVRTNIVGTQNVIKAALTNRVARVIFTSSDKAVNPTNVMGTTKLMGERLITSAAAQSSHTIFASTRFGNVLGSRGSVVPLFRRQIEAGGPITLTDREMTRFIMTVSDAAALVLSSVWLACGGEVMVTKMPIARIEDLAFAMRDILGGDSDVEITEIGAKPGEKMYEELMNDEEVRRTRELQDFFSVLPAFNAQDADKYNYIAGCPMPDRPYNSSIEAPMSRGEVANYLKFNGLVL